ncbi:DUF222 domain-containing protein [Desertihabitans brevis]|uniref:DUF222 domain-containing protein n=1 Tax=Desertihabitans brevis TaxID=2268447 RepID=A0A367YU69_9ACTN|nr:DUF222 domain-containing protein [Desertihabitans brevis]
MLVRARELRSVALAAEAALLEQAAVWADLHPPVEPWLAAGRSDGGRATGIPLAGAGTPEVAVDAVAEWAASLGLSTGSGERLIGQALELRHRLPRLWALVQDGGVPAWQARQVAERIMSLTAEAAGFVDAQVAGVVGRIGLTQLERLVETALLRFMPAEAEERRQQAADSRCFRVEHDTTGARQGISTVFGRLDQLDAVALDTAVGEGATALARLGCTDSLDVRRSRAAGDLARRQPALDLLLAEADGDTPAAREGAARAVERVVLYVHLSAAAVAGPAEPGQVENTGTPVTADQVREWCGRPGAGSR